MLLPTVNRVNRAYREEGRIRNASRGAPPVATTQEEDVYIVALSSADPFLTATYIKRELALEASVCTIRRTLHTTGLKCSAAAQGPTSSLSHVYVCVCVL